ncbi:MAG: TolC family protein [Silicimonas sp.]|nr:TolC family protein [Silicimonas sp.]
MDMIEAGAVSPAARAPRRKLGAMVKRAGLVAGLAVLAACTVTPEPFSQAELDRFAADKARRAVAADQEPVTGRIDLYEAMARALKYNLDHKLEVSEVALRFAELKDGEFDMLPDLVARVDWSDRSNDPFSRSIDENGISDPLGSTSADPGSASAGLELSWDVLDYGLSYYRAKQRGDEYLIAEEQRRATINRVMEDVRTAYWRAVAAQRLMGQINQLESRAQVALNAARRQVKSGEGDKLEALRYQREMLETIRAAQELRRDLFVAKNQLAALMNLPQGQKYSVVVPRHARLKTPITALSAKQMTEMALRNRPEMREIAYRLRINEVEDKSRALALLPSIRGYVGVNYDTNDFLVNDNWTEYGARVSWDLMELTRIDRRKKVIKGQDALLDARALALTQAIATQVNVADKRFHNLQHEAETARQRHNVSDQILAQARSEYQSGVGSQREYVRENLNAILASLRYDATYAEMQGAFANVYASVGLDAFDGSLTGNESVEELAKSLRVLWKKRGG